MLNEKNEAMMGPVQLPCYNNLKQHIFIQTLNLLKLMTLIIVLWLEKK